MFRDSGVSIIITCHNWLMFNALNHAFLTNIIAYCQQNRCARFAIYTDWFTLKHKEFSAQRLCFLVSFVFINLALHIKTNSAWKWSVITSEGVFLNFLWSSNGLGKHLKILLHYILCFFSLYVHMGDVLLLVSNFVLIIFPSDNSEIAKCSLLLQLCAVE